MGVVLKAISVSSGIRSVRPTLHIAVRHCESKFFVSLVRYVFPEDGGHS